MAYSRVNWTPTVPLSDTNLNIMDVGIENINNDKWIENNNIKDNIISPANKFDFTINSGDLGMSPGNHIIGKGVFNIIPDDSSKIKIEIYVNSIWRQTGTNYFTIFSDGINMRLVNIDTISHTIYWQGFGNSIL